MRDAIIKHLFSEAIKLDTEVGMAAVVLGLPRSDRLELARRIAAWQVVRAYLHDLGQGKTAEEVCKEFSKRVHAEYVDFMSNGQNQEMVRQLVGKD